MALGTATDPYELRFDAGRICLDLLSTTHPEERLDSVEPLRAWITGSGLVPAGTPLTHADASWLVAFRELRGHVGQLVHDYVGQSVHDPVGQSVHDPVGQSVRGCVAPDARPYDLAPARVAPDARPYDLAPARVAPDARPYDLASARVAPDARPYDLAPARVAPDARPYDLASARVAPDARPYDLALARVNDLARTAPPAPRAVRGEDGTLVSELAGPPECAALLAAVARDTVELLTDPVARASLRQCEGDNCPIVYLDTSRGRRRRWCSSEVCGNRERVARHRRRAALARA